METLFSSSALAKQYFISSGLKNLQLALQELSSLDLKNKNSLAHIYFLKTVLAEQFLHEKIDKKGFLNLNAYPFSIIMNKTVLYSAIYYK